MTEPGELLLRVVRGRVPSLRLERGRWRGDCPWCTGAFEGCTKPAFYVYADYYHCYCCGAHGDAIQFLMRDEGIGFLGAVEWLAKEAGLQ